MWERNGVLGIIDLGLGYYMVYMIETQEEGTNVMRINMLCWLMDIGSSTTITCLLGNGVPISTLQVMSLNKLLCGFESSGYLLSIMTLESYLSLEIE